MRSLKVRALLRILGKRGGKLAHRTGSHRVIHVGKCRTVVAGRLGQEIPTGTLNSIQRDLAPCLGDKWLEDATR